MSLRRALAVLLLAAPAVLAAPAAAAVSSPAAPPASADPLALAAVDVPAAATDVDDFSFDRLEVAYELGRDADGRSTLRTREHFVARFPDHDQNRGIRRAIPALYDGHSTHLEILSVTDERGAERAYETETDDEFLVLTIAVPRGEFVHGEQHYVIEYAQRDVTRHFDDTDDDEFYWDVNGTGWAQPFGEVAASVALDPSLASLVTEAACYTGPEGSTESCAARVEDGRVAVGDTDLGPSENVTVVVAFPSGTFAPAPWDPFAIVPFTGFLGIGAGIAALLFSGIVGLGVWRDARGRGIVVAQYEPPEGVSAFLAAEILGRKNKAMAATLVDFAVRRLLTIVERDGSWGRRDFGLVRLDPPAGTRLEAEEQRMLSVLFAGGAHPVLTALGALGIGPAAPEADAATGSPIRWLDRRDTRLGQHVVREAKAARRLALARGLRRRPSRWPIAIVVLLTVAGFGLCLVTAITAQSGPATALGVIGAMASLWLGIGGIAGLSSRAPLTREGAELRERLQGLAEFIRWAEADRLRMLQSVEGAERRGLDGAGAGAGSAEEVRVIRIYERLLPYAVLFGLEKQWAEELAHYYREQAPDWYASSSGSFAMTHFAASIGSLSSSVSSSYSGSAGSSSSGGSGGGGSSGGGGGGGGGGGV